MASNEYDAFEDSVEPLAEDAAKNTNAMVRTEGRLGRRYMSKGITGLIRLGRRISKDSKNWYFSLCDVIKVFFFEILTKHTAVATQGRRKTGVMAVGHGNASAKNLVKETKLKRLQNVNSHHTI